MCVRRVLNTPIIGSTLAPETVVTEESVILSAIIRGDRAYLRL